MNNKRESDEIKCIIVCLITALAILLSLFYSSQEERVIEKQQSFYKK